MIPERRAPSSGATPPYDAVAASAEQTLSVMKNATAASRADIFRSGVLVELPAEGEVMVTGDLHGNCENLRRIIEVAGLKLHPHRHLILQELVHELDAKDDLCRSYRLVEMAAQLKSMFPDQVHVLLGNHEFSEMLELEIGKRGRELNSAFDDGGRAKYGERWEGIRRAYLAFWKSSPVAVRTASRLFISHSTPRLDHIGPLSLEFLRTAQIEQILSRESPVFNMLWDRDYRSEAADLFAERMHAEVLIVGHTACLQGVRVPNERHIIIDSKDHNARYALVPLDRELGQRTVLAYVRKLNPD